MPLTKQGVSMNDPGQLYFTMANMSIDLVKLIVFILRKTKTKRTKEKDQNSNNNNKTTITRTKKSQQQKKRDPE